MVPGTQLLVVLAIEDLPEMPKFEVQFDTIEVPMLQTPVLITAGAATIMVQPTTQSGELSSFTVSSTGSAEAPTVATAEQVIGHAHPPLANEPSSAASAARAAEIPQPTSTLRSRSRTARTLGRSPSGTSPQAQGLRPDVSPQ